MAISNSYEQRIALIRSIANIEPMYTAIHLKGKELGKYKAAEPDNHSLGHLSRINIFIGRNNSGKSRFLRQIFSSPNLEYWSSQINLIAFNQSLADTWSRLQNIYDHFFIESISDIPDSLLKDIEFVTHNSDFFQIPKKLEVLAQPKSTLSYSLKKSLTSNETKSFRASLEKEINNVVATFPPISQDDIKKSFRKTIYIPTLRGLRGFSSSNSVIHDFYKERTIKDYFEGAKVEDDSIYTGLGLYEDVKKLLLGSTDGRRKIRKFEEFLSRSFFEGADVNIIPNIDDTVVHVKIGDKDEYPIYELGDGIQAIIILTYPLFFHAGEPLNICIEEPDLFLHPGFQRIFLQTLCRKEFESFQFFFTTHSNHFLDMTLDFKDISVYCFSKIQQDEFQIENVSSADNKVLEEIGVRNSSVFLSNCTIWVEGITDRIYIREYLRLFINAQKKTPVLEDVHFSFVEYGGGNITHWSFLDDADQEHPNINVKRLCGKIFLVADQDSTDLSKSGKDKKSIRIKALKSELGDRFYCLKSREIENLLSENIRLRTVKKLERDGSVLKLKSAKRTTIDKTPMGNWIHQRIDGIKRSYEADSGTVKDKVVFAKAAVSSIESYDELSEEAQELAKKIYDFITAQND